MKDVAYYLSKGFDLPMAEYFTKGRRHITSVSPNDNFTLTLKFDNGELRLYDCKPFLLPGNLKLMLGSEFSRYYIYDLRLNM